MSEASEDFLALFNCGRIECGPCPVALDKGDAAAVEALIAPDAVLWIADQMAGRNPHDRPGHYMAD